MLLRKNHVVRPYALGGLLTDRRLVKRQMEYPNTGNPKKAAMPAIKFAIAYTTLGQYASTLREGSFKSG